MTHRRPCSVRPSHRGVARRIVTGVVVAVLAGPLLAAPAAADPTGPAGEAGAYAPAAAGEPGRGLGGSVDSWVAEPKALGPQNNGSSDTESASLEMLRRAIMPAPSGDPFFDQDPPGLVGAQPGQVLAARDVTAVSRPLVWSPLDRVTQYVVRSTDAAGAPSRAIATLVEPTTPWPGPGPRPVVVNATPIDSLGSRCTPGYTMANGLGDFSNVMDFVPPTTMLAADRGYAILIPDHQGPTMAYADPFVSGRVILDTVRGISAVAPALAESRVGVTGYSGGAIAAMGTAKQIDSYAPELAPRFSGVVAGGVPADVRILLRSMSGNAAVGLLGAAVLGMARQHPEIVAVANNLALQMATSAFKDQCTVNLAVHGGTLAPIQAFARSDDALTSPELERLYSTVLMSDVPSPTPLYVYQGAQEFWLPTEGTRNLVGEQCALGADVTYREVLGEHGVAAVTGYPDAMTWLDARLRGEPAAAGCH